MVSISEPVACQRQAARQRRLAHPVGGNRIEAHAEPAAEAAQIVGIDGEGRLGARPVRRQRTAAAERQACAARQQSDQAVERNPAIGKRQLRVRVADEGRPATTWRRR